MKEIENNNNINVFINQNRTKIDEALVSLRFMKEIDDFLDSSDITQREFAEHLGYSEAFVSQLMSGTKKVNTSFINRFEKTYDLVVKFNIEQKSKSDCFARIFNSAIELDVNIHGMNSITQVYSFQINDKQKFDPFTEI